MHVPVLKASGRIIAFTKLGFTVESKDGKDTFYLCCEKRTEFDAKKNTPLSSKRPIKPSDFHVGDQVDVYYETLNNIVYKLKLIKRPAA